MNSPALREQLADRTLLEVADLLDQRQVSSLELTDATLARLTALEPALNAFVTVLAEQARADAGIADAEIAAGDRRGPLHGVPLSVKDLFATAGIRTTAGSRILADNVTTEDATVVTRLREAGAIIVGKTNMLEFAYAAVHPDYGPAANPWDLHRSTSGSSSGSAAAVAAGIGYGSIGSDTGGSIRLPAAYCGIVGLKPTYGRVSRHGAVPVSWSCDHVGPMTRSVADAAALLGAVAGEDTRDSTTGRVPVPDYLAALTGDLAGLRVGIADAYLRHHVVAGVQRLVETALADLERMGATIVEIVLPPPSEAVPALIGIISPEATAFHLPWLRESPEAYSQAVRERLELGAITSAVTYIDAQRARRRVTDAMLTAMRAVDVVVMPTAPTAATLQDDDLVSSDVADPTLLAALINFTGPFDLTGFPAISLPCGFTELGLPVGLQLVARPYAEAQLLAAAHGYEQAHDWGRRLPTAIASLLGRAE